MAIETSPHRKTSQIFLSPPLCVGMGTHVLQSVWRLADNLDPQFTPTFFEPRSLHHFSTMSARLTACELPGILLSSAPPPCGSAAVIQGHAMLCIRLLCGFWGFNLRSSDFHSYRLFSPLMLGNDDFVNCENVSLPRHLLISLMKQLNGY